MPDTDYFKLLCILQGADALKKRNGTKGGVHPFGGIKVTSGWRME